MVIANRGVWYEYFINNWIVVNVMGINYYS